MLKRVPEKQNIDFNTYRKAFSICEIEDPEEVIKGGIKIKKQKAKEPSINISEDKIIIEKAVYVEKPIEVEKIVEKPVDRIIERTVIVSRNEREKIETIKNMNDEEYDLAIHNVRGDDIPWLI